MRLRVLELPRDQYVLVLDKVGAEHMKVKSWTEFGEGLREVSKDACVGCLAFEGDVELDNG